MTETYNDKGQEFMPHRLHNGRSEVIHQAVIELSAKPGFSWRALSDRVVELWLERTPEHERTLTFRTDPHPVYHEKHNGDTLAAMFNPKRTVRPPIELEEPLVLALEEQGAKGLCRSLARRYGFYGVEIKTGETSLTDVAEFTREFSEGLAALGGLAAGGDKAVAISELEDVVAAAKSLISQIQGEVV